MYQKYDFSQILLTNHSFFVSERENEQFTQRNERFNFSLIYHERPERIAHSCSIVMRGLSDSHTVAHLSWAIWANCAQSLIWYERSERWANSQPWFIPSVKGSVFMQKFIFLGQYQVNSKNIWFQPSMDPFFLKQFGLLCQH